MLEGLKTNDIKAWAQRFITKLRQTRSAPEAPTRVSRFSAVAP
jgi:hypothetical protein